VADQVKYAAFMRAINVAGHAVVRMTDLSAAFAAAGCLNVRTHIQSGNVVFQAPSEESAAVFRRIQQKLEDLVGAEPVIMFRTVRELERIVDSAPFKGWTAGPKVKLYVTFLAEKPRKRPRFPLVSAKEALEAIGMKNREVFVVSRPKKTAFFGFPNNFIEKELGVSATTRNWSTITTIVESTRQRE
jgi:uncharacterized protein (DUF1697 family)